MFIGKIYSYLSSIQCIKFSHHVFSYCEGLSLTILASDKNVYFLYDRSSNWFSSLSFLVHNACLTNYCLIYQFGN